MSASRTDRAWNAAICSASCAASSRPSDRPDASTSTARPQPSACRKHARAARSAASSASAKLLGVPWPGVHPLTGVLPRPGVPWLTSRVASSASAARAATGSLVG
eukprot:1033776-Pyramimonas_sp.AAC.1